MDLPLLLYFYIKVTITLILGCTLIFALQQGLPTKS
jgi:hypothetical protein